MTLTTLGWAVVHSLWLCTFLAGLSALILSTLPDRHARARHLVAYVSLIAMLVLPLATALVSADPMGDSIRRPMMRAVDDAVGLPAILSVRAVVVPSSHARSTAINSRAVPILRQRVLAAQSAAFDTVSGATVTSDGYRSSLQAILNAAK